MSIAEQGLRFSHPDGLDDEIRSELARAILIAVCNGQTDALVIASIALQAYASAPLIAAESPSSATIEGAA